MIVLRTPKGWTGPAEIDGKPVEGTWRAHQVPFADVRGNNDHTPMLEDWITRFRPDEPFQHDGPPPAYPCISLPPLDSRTHVNPQHNRAHLHLPPHRPPT